MKRSMVEQLEPRQLFAAVTVNAAQTVRTIDPRFSGTNLAWWQGELNTTQLKNMVSAAGLSLIRMPGGSAVDDNWHFNNPAPYNGYQTAPIMANMIQSVGADSIVTLNYGTSSPQESAAELAYFNAPVGSNVSIGTGQQWNASTSTWVNVDWKNSGYWASLRAARPLATDDGLNFLRVNHATPWNFSYYEIGNEEYATWEHDEHSSTHVGGSSPSTYIGFAKTFSTLALQIDSDVKVGIDVSPPLKYNMPDANWTSDLLAQSASQGFTPGFLSDHIYVTGLSDQNLLLHSVNDPNFRQDNYNSSWAGRASYYRNLITQKLGATFGAGVQLMVTEFNSDINSKQADNLIGGLWTADALGGLAQTEYTAAVQWDLTNGYNALSSPDTSHYGWRQGVDEGLISTGSSNGASSGTYVPYPIYFAQQLFSKFDQAGGQVLPVSSSDANLSSYGVKLPNGHIRLLVINKSAASTLTGTFNFSNFIPSTSVTQWQYGIAEDVAQSQTTDGHSALTTSNLSLSGSGSSVSTPFPAYSMSVIDLTPAAPKAVSTAYAYRVAPNTVTFQFDQPINASTLSASDLSLTRQGGGSVPAVTAAALSSDGLTATFSLATVGNGTYIASLPAGSISGSYSNAQSAAANFSFFMLIGDANHDGKIDANDYAAIDVGFQNQHNAGFVVDWASGDFNYDGKIDANDYALIDAGFQNQSPPAQLRSGGGSKVGPSLAASLSSRYRVSQK